jgi:glutamine synthetase
MAKYTAQEIISLIDEEDVKFIRLQFVDFFGELKNIAITAGQIGKALAGKCRVDGFTSAGMKYLGYNSVLPSAGFRHVRDSAVETAARQGRPLAVPSER